MEKEKKILITAFLPFGGDNINPTELILNELNDEIKGVKIEKFLLPVEFLKSIEEIKNYYDMIKPDALIMLGLAGGRREISVEIVARNIRNARIPDNSGYQPVNEEIIKDSDYYLYNTLPNEMITEILEKENIPVKISNDAGMYVCNNIFYAMLEYNKGNIPTGFIHVPYIKENGHLDKPYMTLLDEVKAINLIIDAVIPNLDKYYLFNSYFIIGNAYAGKSTMIKMLADEYKGIWCEENYHDRLLETLDKEKYPNLCYTRDLVDFHDFIRRSPLEYERWVNDVSKECEDLELKILKEVPKNKLCFVDTNIGIDTLKKITPLSHVLVMLADPSISVDLFFNRPDKEKQYLYKLIMEEKDPDLALLNFRKCLERINSKERYNEFMNSGFNVLLRDDNRKVEETLEIVKDYFKLKEITN